MIRRWMNHSNRHVQHPSRIQRRETTQQKNEQKNTISNSQNVELAQNNLNKRKNNTEIETRPRRKHKMLQHETTTTTVKSNLDISGKQFKKRKQNNTEKQDEEQRRKKWKSGNIRKQQEATIRLIQHRRVILVPVASQRRYCQMSRADIFILGKYRRLRRYSEHHMSAGNLHNAAHLEIVPGGE